MNCSHATLGKNIRTLRNARGLSQEALAQDAQITQSHLGCIERGRGNPTVYTIFIGFSPSCFPSAVTVKRS